MTQAVITETVKSQAPRPEPAKDEAAKSETPKSVVLILAYDGTAFRGWQRLPGAGRTVQEAVENALVAISGEGLPVSGASRTDGGVHASGQCAMFRSARAPEPERLLLTLNKALPRDVACLGVRTAVHNFDPRYRATAKTYIYRLHDGASPDKTAGRYSLHVDTKLDDDAMIEALGHLAGEHDFSAFTNAKPGLAGKDFTGHLFESRLERRGAVVGLVFKGDGFLYNQVRIMAAAVVDCGAGRMAPADISRLLRSGDRGSAPGALSARGLRLATVDYRESDFLSGYVPAGAAPGNAEGQPPSEALAAKPFLRYVLRQP
ncbi:MAG: tRNA pseudouridine(38-40) synthase TruA [Spirochaetota bacterium]